MGLDVADGCIAKSATAGDLAITADIPLAAALVTRGVVVLDLRGTVYTDENVGEALALRNFQGRRTTVSPGHETHAVSEVFVR